MSMRAKNRMKSSWTPMSDKTTNNKLYDERKGLVTKWFDQWSDVQRKHVFDVLVKKCKGKQLDYLRDAVNDKAPVYRNDFTSVVPRVISLYIFSFLDPRSLCRSSQVSWYWHYLTELDILWMVKCMRLGWYLTFTPSIYESGMWKKNYIEHIQSLQVLQSPSIKQRMNNLSPRGVRKYRDGSKKNDKDKTPWRGSDPVPVDILRRKKKGGEEANRLTDTVKSKVFTGNNALRSFSASRLHSTSNGVIGAKDRSNWTDYGKKKHHTIQIATVPRPGPVSPPPKTQRSHQSPARTDRDPPSSDLFPKKPWDLPDYDSDN